MKSNITLETFEGIVIEQLKERGYNKDSRKTWFRAPSY